MFLKSRSSLVFILCFIEAVLQNISPEMSKKSCGGITAAFSARVQYDKATSESTFNGCVTGNDVTAIELLSKVSTIEADTFVNMPELYSLNMRSSGIGALKGGFFKNTPSLKDIDITTNDIGFIPKDAFSHLNLSTSKWLDSLLLSSNKISSIEAGAFASSRMALLDLRNNKLSEINGSWFDETSIVDLDLSFNQITSLYADTFKEVVNLRYLYLHKNRIYFIDNNTFRGLDLLRNLFLSWNSLNTVKFLNNTRLEHIDLSFNLISSMDMDRSMKFDNILIYPNPWNCECLMKFWKYAWRHRINYSYASSYANTQTKLLCLVHSNDCNNNYGHPEVQRKYFKLINYARFEPTLCMRNC